MQIFKITLKIPKSTEEVFKYITTQENFPKWKKDVWIAGRKYGEMGTECRFIQTIYLMSPRRFMMHVTGYQENKFFKFEARKGFVILPAYSFSFEEDAQGTLFTIITEVNLNGAQIRGLLYPLGLTWHWKVFSELLSKELFRDRTGKIEVISFESMRSAED